MITYGEQLEFGPLAIGQCNALPPLPSPCPYPVVAVAITMCQRLHRRDWLVCHHHLEELAGHPPCLLCNHPLTLIRKVHR